MVFFSHERTISPGLPHQPHPVTLQPPYPPPSSLGQAGPGGGAPCSRQRFLPFTPTPSGAKGGSLESDTGTTTSSTTTTQVRYKYYVLNPHCRGGHMNKCSVFLPPYRTLMRLPAILKGLPDWGQKSSFFSSFIWPPIFCSNFSKFFQFIFRC